MTPFYSLMLPKKGSGKKPSSEHDFFHIEDKKQFRNGIAFLTVCVLGLIYL